MAAISSPVLYPASSSPAAPAPTKKRRLFQAFATDTRAKKPRVVGGFLEDSDFEEEEEVDDGPNRHEAELPRQPNQRPAEDHTPTLQTGTADDGVAPPVDPLRASLPAFPRPLLRKLPATTFEVRTSSGVVVNAPVRPRAAVRTYQEMIAQRSTAVAGRAKTAYYGVDIHRLMDEAQTKMQLDQFDRQRRAQSPTRDPPAPAMPAPTDPSKPRFQQMWTEKYRAKKFTDLVGDERIHRAVLRWLKSWDPIVFPGSAKPKPGPVWDDKDPHAPTQHKKVLLLAGPPGLGKTTLAHVCARQAGYEVLEINASDDRSRDVVKGRIKDSLGTETVRGIQEQGQARRAGRPVCVVVDEVDGVTTGAGSSGGEGGFIKALIDLVQLDHRNTGARATAAAGRSAKGDRFRMRRPLILVCNDLYAPSLRPLRTSSIAEIVYVRRAPIDKVIGRLKTVFEKEDIACENDAVRRLCENAWGLGKRQRAGPGARGSGEGDIRGVLVQAEWIAHKLRAAGSQVRLTRQWLDPHLGDPRAAERAVGGGGVREVVERVFVEGAALPPLPTVLSAENVRLVRESNTNPTGVADLRKRAAVAALREMADTCGEHDRLVTDCFATYPTRTFQDDVQLSKPNASYDWLHFHDCLSRRVFSGQEWELTPYLSSSICGFHDLFAAVDKGTHAWSDDNAAEEPVDVHPFSGLKADFAAFEAEKHNRTLLVELQSNFSAPLRRLFSAVDTIATELIPNVGRMLAPDVKPVVVGGARGFGSVASVRKDTEKTCVSNAVRAMIALDLSFEKVRVEHDGGAAHANAAFAYRMEPALDTLLHFHQDKSGTAVAPVRYAVRQVLDQELKKAKTLQMASSRHARSVGRASQHEEDHDGQNKENQSPLGKATNHTGLSDEPAPKRDFFGRIINDSRPQSAAKGHSHATTTTRTKDEGRVWVSFHEGFSNAVRKPITLKELMEGF